MAEKALSNTDWNSILKIGGIGLAIGLAGGVLIGALWLGPMWAENKAKKEAEKDE